MTYIKLTYIFSFFQQDLIRARYSIIIMQKIELGGNSRAFVVPKDRKLLHLVVPETLIQYTTKTFFEYQNLFLR